MPSQCPRLKLHSRSARTAAQVPLSWDFASLIPPGKSYTLREAVERLDKQGIKARGGAGDEGGRGPGCKVRSDATPSPGLGTDIRPWGGASAYKGQLVDCKERGPS